MSMATRALNPEEVEQCQRLLQDSTMFHYLSPGSRQSVAKRMRVRVFQEGDVLQAEGEPCEHMFCVADGEVRRFRKEGQSTVEMDTLGREDTTSTFGILHLARNEPYFATARAMTGGKVYTLSSANFNDLIANPTIAQESLHSLSMELRQQYRARTPMFQQTADGLPVFAICCASATESFYRSALNAMINAKLTGKMGGLFPNMHVQLPMRVSYILGFKTVRYLLDEKVDRSKMGDMQNLGLACVPGLAMTPFSSMLEACNAGHLNPEPLWRRWTRGIAWRSAREVIFGIGLNQMSDFTSERIPAGLVGEGRSPARTMAGSLVAGVAAGYFSHIPHNLSTLKLMDPSKSYLKHFQDMAAKNAARVPEGISGGARTATANALTLLAPAAIGVRTTQIVGSFMILNGGIVMLSDFDIREKLGMAPKKAKPAENPAATALPPAYGKAAKRLPRWYDKGEEQ